jgi:DNA-nicking Smr family endonuclease
MAKAAIRSTMDSYLERKNPEYSPSKDLVIITGKGLNSVNDPVLKGTVLRILTRDYGVEGKVEESNQGRIVVDVQALLEFVGSKSWR